MKIREYYDTYKIHQVYNNPTDYPIIEKITNMHKSGDHFSLNLFLQSFTTERLEEIASSINMDCSLLDLFCRAGLDPHHNNDRQLIVQASWDSDTLQRLLDIGADPNTTNGAPLIVAIYNGKLQSIATLLKAGANITEEIINAAVLSYNPNILDLLINNGADPNLCLKNTLLMMNIGNPNYQINQLFYVINKYKPSYDVVMNTLFDNIKK